MTALAFYRTVMKASGDASPSDGEARMDTDTYLHDSGDTEILGTLHPFFAFRALAIGWSAALSRDVRGALINFARRMMAVPRFDRADVDALFGPVP